MKKKLLIASLVVLICILFVACKPQETPADIKMELSDTNIQMDIKETFVLGYSVTENGVEVKEGITWESSDESVATVKDGVIEANRSGKATITARYKDAKATCDVSVSAYFNPRIELNIGVSDNISIAKKGVYTISPKIVYGGRSYTDAEWTFTSENPEIVSVDSKGKLQGLSIGETNIIVTAKWSDFDESILTAVLKVDVQSDIELYIETPKNNTVGTTTLNREDIGYSISNTLDLSYIAVLEGSDITEGLQWIVDDPSIVKVDNGVVIGLKEGEAEITLAYSCDGKLHVSNVIVVNVVFPVVDITSVIELPDADLIGLNNGEYKIFADALFGAEKNHSIVSVEDVTDKTTVQFTINALGNDALVSGNGIVGERIWKISCEGYAVKVPIFVATAFIDSADDFENLITVDTYGDTVTDEHKNAYYVITKDIDMSTYKGIGIYDGGWKRVFYGTIDGRNHILSNFTSTQQKGFIACVGGTIKNIQFVNATNDGKSGIVASQLLKGAVIENVKVTGKITVDGAIWGPSTMFAGLTNAGVTYRNCEVTVTGLPAATTYVGLFCTITADGVVFDNCKAYVSDSLVSVPTILMNRGGSYSYDGEVSTIVVPQINVNDYFDFEVSGNEDAMLEIDLSEITLANSSKAWEGSVTNVELGGLPLDYTLNGNVLSILESALPIGENQIHISNNKNTTYVLKVVKATAFIENVADLNTIITHPVYGQGTVSEEAKKAYYVIKNDIDLSNFAGIGTYDNAVAKNWTDVFYGTIDGRNHTLSGYTAKQQKGIVACLGGTLKNINLTDVTNEGKSGVVSSQLLAGAVIENVHVTGKITGDGASWMASSLFVGNINASVTIKDSSVRCTSIPTTTTYTTLFGKLNGNGAVFTNCKVYAPESATSVTTIFENGKTYTGTVERITQ